MRILVDTNVLMRSAHPNHPQQQVAAFAVTSLRSAGHELAIVPQVLYEFWVASTRPVAQNGLGFSAQQADDELRVAETLYSILFDDATIVETWRKLVVNYNVLGKPAHDARLVAAMLRHGVTHLLTFNTGDFERFTEITALAPTESAALPPASG
jgi:predicted nucleic acid-binding protein